MRKIVTIIGARPQFIKASVVSNALAKSGEFVEVLVHTGQHFDSNMSDVFFSDLGIQPPDHQLDIHGGFHGEMTGRMLMDVEKVLLGEKPDAVMVYGDTNSTLAGALAAAKLHIPIAHVESGLRSFNMAMPEEVNRILTDRIATWLFTPTEAAARNLLDEGMARERIIGVGDVMFDVALHFGSRVATNGRLMAKLGLKPREYVLATIHRAENTSSPERLATIVDGLRLAADSIRVVWPMHPRARSALEKMGLLQRLTKKLHVIDPVGYLDMVQLEKYAAVIATDSGGIQKEAFFYEVPCVTLRSETEWVELVEAGWNRLVACTDPDELASSITRAAGDSGKPIQPYGDGKAAEKIVKHLRNTVDTKKCSLDNTDLLQS